MVLRAGITSSGLWRIRKTVHAVTGYDLIYACGRAEPADYDVLVGWGRRPSARDARALAAASGKPFLTMEDGFLRSVQPGPEEAPASIVMDWTGVHYDAHAPSEFEDVVEACAKDRSAIASARARAGMHLLRELAVSKYNNAPQLTELALGLGRRPQGGRVLVVDQTMGDGAIYYGMASETTFTEMLAAAKAENPGAQIIVKTHPEVVSGRKRGYLSGADGDGVVLIDAPVNPWSLIQAVDQVYVVSSLLGFEALLAGARVSCFGAPFYAGWGLTADRIVIARRKARPSLEQLFSAAYLQYSRYAHPVTGEKIEFEDAVLHLAKARDQALGVRRERRSKRAAIDNVAAGARWGSAAASA
ncbi:MAG: hypothetical protein NW215_15845 [Hyphomicrobiales bacterium]|nr:hypothetical protein [Hyphomicrobiales bacterium]